MSGSCSVPDCDSSPALEIEDMGEWEPYCTDHGKVAKIYGSEWGVNTRYLDTDNDSEATND